MSKLYLITGFLGAGKTTFLKNFIRLFAGQKIQLIVNEFGREGVDGALLSDLGAYLDEISGGSIFCSCRLDQFEKVLANTKDINADVILVEASGLSDPTGVRKLFTQTQRFPHIDYQGAVCLVDSIRFPKLYATARTCVKQLASSDIVLMNKVDVATDEQIAATRNVIITQRPDLKIVKTSFGAVDANILDLLSQSQTAESDAMPLIADLTLRKLFVTVSPTMTSYELQKFLEMFLEVTFRVKGFIQTTDDTYLVDCVGNTCSVTRYTQSIDSVKLGELTILSGSGMPTKKRVQEAISWYPDKILSME